MAIVVRVSNDRMQAIVEVERQTDEPLDVDALKRALADGAVDFHNRGSFTPIAQGQLIATIVLPTAGSSGTDVFGTPI
jgi:uncharacterized protein (DUF342 family)